MPPQARRRKVLIESHSSESPRISLVDLPNELLLMMVDDLSCPDLCSLATSCKRLNQFVLPIYFLNTRKYYSSNISATSGCHDFRIGPTRFPVAFFITALSTASCTYNGENYPRVRAFQRLVSRMSNVWNVTLQFSVAQLNNWKITDEAKQRILRRGIEALPGILDTLSGKSCSTLELRGEPLHDDRRVPAPTRPLTQLVSFVGHSIALSSSLKNWTIQSLNASPIRELSLHKLATTEWDDVLPHLNLPLLAKLEVGIYDHHLNAVSTFLTRHPGITDFAISGKTTLLRSTRLAAGSHPHILRLQSNPQTMYRLIGFRTKNAFPNIRSVVIISGPDGDETDFKMIHNLLDRLTYHDHVSSVSIDLPKGQKTIQWLNSPSTHKLGSRLGHILTIDIGHSMVLWDKQTLATVPGWLSATLPSVQYASINARIRDFTQDDEVAFVRSLVETHPQIRTVRIHFNMYRLDMNWLSTM